ncbi:MAG: hypothetical protein KAU03_04145, partial [Candidatus Altiarchaeales archaeon]|nr:hypothetical protein [Candidatus Altiarchaeales archaeon]
CYLQRPVMEVNSARSTETVVIMELSSFSYLTCLTYFQSYFLKKKFCSYSKSNKKSNYLPQTSSLFVSSMLRDTSIPHTGYCRDNNQEKE